MKIKQHIIFNNDNRELIAYLQKNGVEYKHSQIISTLDIYENDECWPDLYQIIKRHHIPHLAETQYTNAEISNADWLYVWSRWRFGYPQPEDCFASATNTYDKSNMCPECGIGKNQYMPFEIENAPKWGQRHFGQLYWIFDEIFVDQTAMEILNNIGIVFNDVYKYRKNEKLPNILQIDIKSILAPGIIEEQTDFQKIIVCSKCGRKKYVTSGRGSMVYKDEAFVNAADINKTYEHFGDGRSASNRIIISKNLCKILKENHLDRNLVFEPIVLV